MLQVALLAAALVVPQGFRPGERVAFLGDSITHRGGYLSCLEQWFSDPRRQGKPPELIDCGVNGDSASRILSSGRLEWDLIPLRPERVFVMLGMNDVCIDDWRKADEGDPEVLVRREGHVRSYRENLGKLVGELRSAGMDVVLMTPSPYDQYGRFDDDVRQAANEPGLASCADAVRDLGHALGVPVIDLHAPMTEMLRRGSCAQLCGPDRIHPLEDGSAVMAAIILRSCGETADDVETVADSLRNDPRATKAAAYASALSDYRRLAEYRQVILGMKGDVSDISSCDRILDAWVERSKGRSWHDDCRRSAEAYRRLRGRDAELGERVRRAREDLRGRSRPSPADDVDPFIGTAGKAHCVPHATLPFAFVQPGPLSGNGDWRYTGGYQFADSNLFGFVQNALSGTGCPDLGDLLVQPFAGDPVQSDYRRMKSNEVAEPGYYSVDYGADGIRTEITASEHVAFYRIRFAGEGSPRLLLDRQHQICFPHRIGKNVIRSDFGYVDESTVTGHARVVNWVYRDYYYAIRFSRPIAEERILPKGAPTWKADRRVFGFDLGSARTLEIKIGMSARSSAQALANIDREIPDWDFMRLRRAAREAWDAVLARLMIDGTPAQRRNFATALYHLCYSPNNIADAGDAPDYGTLSLWDTFRAAHPLYTLLVPERIPGFVCSVLADYRQRGHLPIWALWDQDAQCMIGSHAVPVLVDAFLKRDLPGLEPLKAVDWNFVFEAIRNTLTKSHPGLGKESWDLLDRYGYYPFDLIKGESVSRTMECAYDAWCAAQMAEKLGHGEDAAFFLRRSAQWKNVFDPSIGFARGKDSQGRWREPFDPYALGHGADLDNDFTEGNAFQYSWHVMQDPQGLVSMMGGCEAFGRKLDALFAAPDKVEGAGLVLDVTGLIGQYVHGNEPSHHVIYFYPQIGHPEKAAERIREVFDRFYLPKPDGLCGNDDCGQMSAWYLFSAMGFYPFNPCGGEYVIGAPQVPKAQVKVRGEGEQWKFFTMTAKNLSKENKYVKSVILNGKPLEGFILKHADIVVGGNLVFEMTDRPPAPRVADAVLKP